MGVLLSTPITEKETVQGESERLQFAAVAMQGWRPQMEDAHIAVPQLTPTAALFGVYDGHGGLEVSKFVSRHLPQVLTENENFKKGNYTQALKEVYLRMDELLQTKDGKSELHEIAQTKSPQTGTPSQGNAFDILEALTRSIRARDGAESVDATAAAATAAGAGNDAKDEKEKEKDKERDIDMMRYGFFSGSTAVTALVIYIENSTDPSNIGQIFVANAGDSRCVLSHAGKAVELSQDHKPYLPTEYQRIVKAGGSVDGGRVKGDLNLSRALGDLQYKQREGLAPEEQMITCNPDISTTQLSADDEFLIIACDGIWDVKTSQQAVDYVSAKLKENLAPAQICQHLLDDCLASSAAGAGTDNMTVEVIIFKHPTNNKTT